MEAALLLPASGSSPKVLWKIPARDGFSSFAISGGQAFTLVARPIEGVQREVCLALNVETGKEIWAVPLDVAKYDAGAEGRLARRKLLRVHRKVLRLTRNVQAHPQACPKRRASLPSAAPMDHRTPAPPCPAASGRTSGG